MVPEKARQSVTGPRITLLSSLEERLVDHLESHPAGHERAAAILFRRISRPAPGLSQSDRYLAVAIEPFQDAWIASSSASHVAFHLKFLRDIFRKCEEESLVFGFAHNHPGGFSEFSDTDEDNERTLLQALTNRNGMNIHLVAMLWTNKTWKSRVRHGQTPTSVQHARHVLVTGRPLKIFAFDAHSTDEISARQAAAFGSPFTRKLSSLRVGVVGAGGTGSPTITLLARAGVRELVVVDNDTLERSNLNRVRGAGVSDIGTNKARIAQSFISDLQLPTEISAFPTRVDDDPSALDAISSCDVIFGCTDDQIGREVLNTAAYVYAQPYIDVGLGGQIAIDNAGEPYLRYHYGRISTILPETGECLFCQGVIKEAWIQHEYALRANPRLAEAEARERYLVGGGEQAPGIGPFTSAAADFGVATLFDLIKPFRKFPPELRFDQFKVDFVKLELRSSAETNDLECVYCRQKTYLLLNEEYRLNRPALGKPSAAL